MEIPKKFSQTINFKPKKGQRGLTVTQKKKFKESKGHVCANCGIVFPSKLLDVDHKRPIYTYPHAWILDEVGESIVLGGGKKIPMHYDKLKYLQVLCKACHKEKTKREAGERAKNKKNRQVLGTEKSIKENVCESDNVQLGNVEIQGIRIQIMGQVYREPKTDPVDSAPVPKVPGSIKYRRRY